jgi:hypothetical protein
MIGESGSGIDIVRGGIFAEGSSQATVLGGILFTNGSGGGARFGIMALGNSQVDVLGGSISLAGLPTDPMTAIAAMDNARITIFGSNFNFPLGAIGPLAGTITGKLQDGSSINWTFTHTAASSITLVPEPSTILLSALGTIGLLFTRRRVSTQF